MGLVTLRLAARSSSEVLWYPCSRNARAEGGLARRGLAESRRQYASHDHFLDVGGRNRAFRQRRGNRGHAELWRGGRRQHTLERADGRAGGGGNDDL